MVRGVMHKVFIIIMMEKIKPTIRYQIPIKPGLNIIVFLIVSLGKGLAQMTYIIKVTSSYRIIESIKNTQINMVSPLFFSLSLEIMLKSPHTIQ